MHIANEIDARAMKTANRATTRKAPGRSLALPVSNSTSPNVMTMAEDFARQIESHRGYLLRVAQLQLRDRDSAEDVVQDTLLAALAAASGFSGKSSRELLSWNSYGSMGCS